MNSLFKFQSTSGKKREKEEAERDIKRPTDRKKSERGTDRDYQRCKQAYDSQFNVSRNKKIAGLPDFF